MSSRDKQRLEALRKIASIAKRALTRIAQGCRDPMGVAAEALDEIEEHSPDVRPLQGLVGHELPA